MDTEPKTMDTFFDHLGKAGQPTKLGAGLVRRAARHMMAFAAVAPGSRVLEIGPLLRVADYQP